MTEAQVELAKRAVACKGWRWRCGMFAALDGIDGGYRARVCLVEGDKFWSDATSLPYDSTSYVPDLSDPATLGCLLALVREAWGQDDLGAFRVIVGQWCAEVTPQEGQHHAFYGSSEAEALVAALEAAP
jgi:hypothetical protein